MGAMGALANVTTMTTLHASSQTPTAEPAAALIQIIGSGPSMTEWPVGSIGDVTGDGLADCIKIAPLIQSSSINYSICTSDSNFSSYVTANMGTYNSAVL